MISVDGLTVDLVEDFGGCPSAFPRKSDCPQGLCSRLSSTAFDDGGRSYGF